MKETLLKESLRLIPKELGFKGPKYSKEKPGILVKVESVRVGNRETGIQYCAEQSYKDYLPMMDKMKKDIGKQLFIDSGYRSPGRQALFGIFII